MIQYGCRGVAQLVARSVWDAEVACSSQVAPTIEDFVHEICVCSSGCFGSMAGGDFVSDL